MPPSWPTAGSRTVCASFESPDTRKPASARYLKSREHRFSWHCTTQRYSLLRNRHKETGRNSMSYSLSEAAKATGKNKTTIQRAIKSGKISATKGDRGAYEISPSELHRVFPASVAQLDAQRTQSNDAQRGKVASYINRLERVLELEKELAVAKERTIGLEASKDQMADTINDLRKRLDSSESRVTALLADHRPRSFWGRLLSCSIPDDHISPRRSALFMARSVLRDFRDGGRQC